MKPFLPIAVALALFACSSGSEGPGAPIQTAEFPAKCREASLYSCAVISRHTGTWEIVYAPVLGTNEEVWHAECRALLGGRWWWIEPSLTWGWGVDRFEQPVEPMDMEKAWIFTDLSDFSEWIEFWNEKDRINRNS